MSKTLSLAKRGSADSATKSSAESRTNRAPIRGRNRNNHAVSTSANAGGGTDTRQKQGHKQGQKPASGSAFVKSAENKRDRSERSARPERSGRPERSARPERPERSSAASQKSGSARPSARSSNQPFERSAKPAGESAHARTTAKPADRAASKFSAKTNAKSSAKPNGKAPQTILRHGKARDGVREFADGRVVQGKRKTMASTESGKRVANPDLHLKSVRDERDAPKTQSDAPAPSGSKFNRAPAPESAASGIRISKYLADQGLCSRREADAYIEKGWVTVNGKRVELGQRIQPTDRVQLARQASAAQASRVTILINKPVGYVSGQAEDGYAPAVSLVTAENQWEDAPFQQDFEFKHLRGLAPAGRLDIDSVGLLVLTQDGRVAKQLIGEDSETDKEYLVRVEGELIEEGLKLLNHGLELDGVPLRRAQVSWQNEDQLRFVLREGKKRQIRRMCELVGLKVVGLKRIRIGKVKLGNLPTGKWRYLAEDEAF